MIESNPVYERSCLAATTGDMMETRDHWLKDNALLPERQICNQHVMIRIIFNDTIKLLH